MVTACRCLLVHMKYMSLNFLWYCSKYIRVYLIMWLVENIPLKCFLQFITTTTTPLHFQSSLSVVAFETGISSAVALDVIREGGTFGDVSASWEVTGDHVEGEITPSSGEVESDFYRSLCFTLTLYL